MTQGKTCVVCCCCWCCRDQKESLSRECAKEVFLVQKAIAYDYRADPAMAAACKEDVEQYCKDVKDGGGRKAACLVSAALRAGLLACVLAGWLAGVRLVDSPSRPAVHAEDLPGNLSLYTPHCVPTYSSHCVCVYITRPAGQAQGQHQA
jgi:hypothetical protein